MGNDQSTSTNTQTTASTTADVSSKLGNLKIGDRKSVDVKNVNILLLGESGCGKSTLINAISNYFKFRNYEKAKSSFPTIKISTKFKVTDVNFQQKEIFLPASSPFNSQPNSSLRYYSCELGEGRVKLFIVDTPGIGKGDEVDEKNCTEIINFLLRNYLHVRIHAVCFLTKLTNFRVKSTFEFYHENFLSRLGEDAYKNLVFIFTHTQPEKYKGGETYSCLEETVKKISEKERKLRIPLDKNVFFLDNEGFRILTATQNGVTFSEDTKKQAATSWKQSAEECTRLVNYILGDASNEPLVPFALNIASLNAEKTQNDYKDRKETTPNQNKTQNENFKKPHHSFGGNLDSRQFHNKTYQPRGGQNESRYNTQSHQRFPYSNTNTRGNPNRQTYNPYRQREDPKPENSENEPKVEVKIEFNKPKTENQAPPPPYQAGPGPSFQYPPPPSQFPSYPPQPPPGNFPNFQPPGPYMPPPNYWPPPQDQFLQNQKNRPNSGNFDSFGRGRGRGRGRGGFRGRGGNNWRGKRGQGQARRGGGQNKSSTEKSSDSEESDSEESSSDN